MPMNCNKRITRVSVKSPWLAERSPNPHVDKVVVTKYMATIY